MRKRVTLIDEEGRRELGIDRDEYALLSYIRYRCADPRSKKAGWCDDTKTEIALFVGVSRQALYQMIDRMEASKLCESDPISGCLRVTALFIDADSGSVKKLDNECQETLQPGRKKVSRKLTLKERDKRVKGEKNNSFGSEDAAKALTKQFAEVLEAVALECYSEAGLNWEPRNWRATAGKDFKSLKQIEAALRGDIAQKKRLLDPSAPEPTDEEILNGWAVFCRFSFQFFTEKFGSKGALNFQPAQILSGYNEIKLYAKNRNSFDKRASSAQSRDQQFVEAVQGAIGGITESDLAEFG